MSETQTDTTKTDEIQNGGQGTPEERIAKLEARLDAIVKQNCLREAGDR